MNEANEAPEGVEAAPLTAADLDRLAALHEAATPGPWKAGSCWITAPRECWIAHDDGSVSDTLVWGGSLAEPTREPETMRLIASMHTALPSLLALARRGLEAERASQTLTSAVGSPRLGEGVEAMAERAAVRIKGFDDAYRKQSAEAGSRGDDLSRRLEIANAELGTVSAQAFRLREQLAAALAEVERLRGRVERADAFTLPGDLEIVRCNAGFVVWRGSEYDENGDPLQIGPTHPSLDAAWSAAEAQGGKAQACPTCGAPAEEADRGAAKGEPMRCTNGGHIWRRS